MESSAGRSLSWVMADGAASISASMLVAVLLNIIPSFAGLWGLGFLHELTGKQDGMIVVATLLLLPTSFIVYGVSQVIFAAKEAVERRAMEKAVRWVWKRADRKSASVFCGNWKGAAWKSRRKRPGGLPANTKTVPEPNDNYPLFPPL